MEKEFEYYYAIKEDDFKTFKSLAADETLICQDIRPYNQSLLLHAALNGSYRICKYLIENGCEVNDEDEKGYTPLQGAAEYGFIKIAKLLLDHKAIVNHRDLNGNTPLMVAVFQSEGNMEMIKLLLKNGANPYIDNNAGVSPYSFALKTGSKNVIDFFNEYLGGN